MHEKKKKKKLTGLLIVGQKCLRFHLKYICVLKMNESMGFKKVV